MVKLIRFTVLICLIVGVKSSLQGEEVLKWANAIGKELYQLGLSTTNQVFIKQMYKFLNARVGTKDPNALLAEIKENILLMMDRKMDAIRCIQQEAERQAEEFEYNSTSKYRYYSSKYSPVVGQPAHKLPDIIDRNQAMYLDMSLNTDTHFYNISVNTSHSSVHVPTNVYDREDDVAIAIQWSEALDNVFVQNYNSDPALSWQYFGSPSGIMRHYPAKRWQDFKKDLFDCRVRTWFVEAATCTKDVVILMDNSGSMDGMGKHIGVLTVNSIMDTFSNNDYVNIFNYSESTNYVIPCFENLLVQATRENIRIFKEGISRLKPTGKTKLSQALEKAFDLLSLYRKKRGCEEDNKMCNQAIMIVTDGISANLSDTINKYIDLYNGSMPRLFTYLIGKEVTNVPEIKWIACANRGYYSHVQSLEQVTASVVKYINVIARPLVLQHEEHPVSWTHAYADLTYNDAIDNQINEPYRLLTSAAIPCFDNKENFNNATGRTANLLGVAATDVPLDDFRRQMFNYKIGVHGYAFIVSNNGYVLMHPDLRPVFEGVLKENYNSIDLTEVEQHNDGLPPKEIGADLQRLRQALVDGVSGSLHGVPLKYHYDNMRRIAEEEYDYYFEPLEQTPFSIGIALPNNYGNVSLDVGDEIHKNRFTGVNLTDFFVGNWKIHPKWVYCKYHYLEGHEFNSSEAELLAFLKKMYDDDFRWERQYEERSESGSQKVDLNKVECGRKTHADDDYYCDRQLVQRLIFDAKNTANAFNNSFQQPEIDLFKKFNATLRFLATMSGLTRWDYIFDENCNSGNKEFGDLHARAIDETWYKSAILQHQYDEESFVYSVPFDAGQKNENLVTGSYAIFPTDAGMEAPGSVVGYQFAHNKFVEFVTNISTKTSNQCSHCGNCKNSTLDCYIVDSSGYVLVSIAENAKKNDTGKFLGEIEGDILDSMLNEKIFKEILIYDFQALCRYSDEDSGSSAMSLLNPLNYAKMTLNWIITRSLWLLFEINLTNLLNVPAIYAAEADGRNTTDDEEEEKEEEEAEAEDDEDDTENDANLYFACEKQISLYKLDQNFISHNFIGEYPKTDLSRAYYIKKIPNSNLIFVAINTTKAKFNDIKYTTVPQKITKAPIWDIHFLNTTLLPCQKLNLNTLPRRPLQGCFNEHPEEKEILECGKSNRFISNTYLLLFILILTLLNR